MAVRKPRVGDERRRCREMVLVLCRWARSSGRGRLLALVRSIVGGKVVGSVRSVSVIQAKRSKTQRTDPARELITSKTVLAIVWRCDEIVTNPDLQAEMFYHCLTRLAGH